MAASGGIIRQVTYQALIPRPPNRPLRAHLIPRPTRRPRTLPSRAGFIRTFFACLGHGILAWRATIKPMAAITPKAAINDSGFASLGLSGATRTISVVNRQPTHGLHGTTRVHNKRLMKTTENHKANKKLHAATFRAGALVFGC
ncbi:hypothetical protein HPB48_015530 [Haemaphysalis longicornis]|uniref:Uncharacterized protein n=1 Tax=Haemaphysalis longicornis TaxID=44386 RepID=A0A9J6FKN5_HAELO|nr:hypothetical protein HPB48_015530 [Haemaphysalis longicornis]